MPPEIKERVKNTLYVLLMIVFAGAAYAAWISVTHIGIPCFYRLFTGFKCAGCGNTTAVLALLRLDFKAAMKANFFMPLEFAYIAWIIINYIVVYIKTGKKELMPKPDVLNWICLGLVLVWTVVRNIFGL